MLFVSLFLIFFPSFFSCLEENDLNEFYNWFQENNGQVMGVDVSSFSEMGRGIRATRKIEKGEKVLFIPHKIIFSSQLAKNSNDKIFQKLMESFPNDDELVTAMVLLERCRGKDSFWYPYIKVLPKYVPNLAQFDKSELKELHNSKLTSDVMESWGQTVNNYNRFLEQVKSYWPTNLQELSLKDYMWASSIIDSRGFRFRGSIHLAPYSDMFNYSPHPEPRASNSGNFFLEHHILSKEGLEVHADRECEKGLQLFEDYGDNSDRIYLQYHGFMPNKNPFRCIQLETKPLTDESIPLKKQQLLKDLQFKRAPAKCVDQSGDLGQGINAFLSVLAMNDEEISRCNQTLHEIPRRSGSAMMLACGISKASELFADLVKKSATRKDLVGFRVDSFEERVYHQLITFLRENTRELVSTMTEDLAVLQSIEKTLKSPNLVESKFYQSLKKSNAVSYRYAMKEHLYQLCMKFGSTCDLTPPQSPSSLSPQEDHSDTFLSQKLTLYDLWNQSSSRTPLTLEKFVSEFNQWFNAELQPLSPPAVNFVEAKAIPRYRIGTVTTKSLELNEIYLAIPPSVIMDLLSAAKSSDIGKLLTNLNRQYQRRDDFHGLLFHLIHEAFQLGSESSFWPYLRLLPSPSEMDIPLFWTIDQINSRLGPSSLREEMIAYKSRVLRTYQMISRIPLLKDLIQLNVLTEQSYVWATAILDSRSIWWNGQRHLVPMLDFVNCEERVNNEVIRIHSTKAERFPLTSGSIDSSENIPLAITRSAYPFHFGEQLFENYGQPNHIYFTYHSFILEGNSNDCVQFSISMTPDEISRIDLTKAKHVFEHLRLEPSNTKIPSTDLCVGPTTAFEEISSRVWVYLSLKSNNYGTSERDLVIRPTKQNQILFAKLIKSHAKGYEGYQNKEYPHALSERFLRSEHQILDRWLENVGKKVLGTTTKSDL